MSCPRVVGSYVFGCTACGGGGEEPWQGRDSEVGHFSGDIPAGLQRSVYLGYMKRMALRRHDSESEFSSTGKC